MAEIRAASRAHVQQNRLAAARNDHVIGVGPGLQAGLDEFAAYVHAECAVAEAVVGHDDDVGLVGEPEFAQAVEQQPDLAIIVADGGARLRRTGADRMLEMVGFGEPIDHDVGRKLSQHVIAQHPLRPRDFFVGWIQDAALFGGGRKPAQDRLVRRIRECDALTRLPKGIDQDPDALRGARVDQQCAPCRPGAHDRERLATLCKDFRKARSQNRAAARDLVETQ